jgi:hypothetical protein
VSQRSRAQIIRPGFAGRCGTGQKNSGECGHGAHSNARGAGNLRCLRCLALRVRTKHLAILHLAAPPFKLSVLVGGPGCSLLADDHLKARAKFSLADLRSAKDKGRPAAGLGILDPIEGLRESFLEAEGIGRRLSAIGAPGRAPIEPHDLRTLFPGWILKDALRGDGAVAGNVVETNARRPRADLIGPADLGPANASQGCEIQGTGVPPPLAEVVCGGLSAISRPIKTPVEPLLEPARLVVSLISAGRGCAAREHKKH